MSLSFSAFSRISVGKGGGKGNVSSVFLDFLLVEGCQKEKKWKGKRKGGGGICPLFFCALNAQEGKKRKKQRDLNNNTSFFIQLILIITPHIERGRVHKKKGKREIRIHAMFSHQYISSFIPFLSGARRGRGALRKKRKGKSRTPTARSCAPRSSPSPGIRKKRVRGGKEKEGERSTAAALLLPSSTAEEKKEKRTGRGGKERKNTVSPSPATKFIQNREEGNETLHSFLDLKGGGKGREKSSGLIDSLRKKKKIWKGKGERKGCPLLGPGPRRARGETRRKERKRKREIPYAKIITYYSSGEKEGAKKKKGRKKSAVHFQESQPRGGENLGKKEKRGGAASSFSYSSQKEKRKRKRERRARDPSTRSKKGEKREGT